MLATDAWVWHLDAMSQLLGFILSPFSRPGPSVDPIHASIQSPQASYYYPFGGPWTMFWFFLVLDVVVATAFSVGIAGKNTRRRRSVPLWFLLAIVTYSSTAPLLLALLFI